VSLISIRDLTVTYPLPKSSDRLVALWKVDLDIEEGEFIVIVGPSGCGKTTLLNTVAGLIKPTQGEVLVRGRRVTGAGPDRAMVFQEYALLPWRTARENVRFGLEMVRRDKQLDDEKVRKAIELVGLAGFERSYPRQLSGGMQQRVGLARALVADPTVLLMDEPFAAVDAMTRDVMQGELERIVGNTAKTAILITHSIDEAIYLADRVIVATTRPGRIKAVVDIDLPRPRWAYDVKADPEYIRKREYVWSLLRTEAASHAHGDDGQER
jgi:NitT/TauT family transport system ATP-binding protein